MAVPRKPWLALSNLLSHDFIFSLFPVVDVIIDSGLNVAVNLCVSEIVPNPGLTNKQTKMRSEAHERNKEAVISDSWKRHNRCKSRHFAYFFQLLTISKLETLFSQIHVTAEVESLTATTTKTSLKKLFELLQTLSLLFHFVNSSNVGK